MPQPSGRGSKDRLEQQTAVLPELCKHDRSGAGLALRNSITPMNYNFSAGIAALIAIKAALRALPTNPSKCEMDAVLE